MKKTGENVCIDILMKSWKKKMAKIWPEALNKLHLKNELNEVVINDGYFSNRENRGKNYALTKDW